jgi:hypothetical protein
MNRTIYLALSSAWLGLSSTVASAHPGDHAGLDWRSLPAHLIEPDHLVYLTLIVLVGLLAYRLGRRAERRVRERSAP